MIRFLVSCIMLHNTGWNIIPHFLANLPSCQLININTSLSNSRHSRQRTNKSQILFQPWCHLYTRKNNSGPRTMSCGTPDKTGAHWDFAPLTTTLCYLLHRNESIHTKVFHLCHILGVCISEVNEEGCQTLFEVQYLLDPVSKILAQSFITVINWVSQLRFFLKACCRSDRSLCSLRWAIIFVYTMCSSILQGTYVNDTGRKFLGKALSPFL